MVVILFVSWCLTSRTLPPPRVVPDPSRRTDRAPPQGGARHAWSPSREGSAGRRTPSRLCAMLDRIRTSPRVFPLVAAPVLGVLGVVEASADPEFRDTFWQLEIGRAHV